jgi:hypothetical protein
MIKSDAAGLLDLARSCTPFTNPRPLLLSWARLFQQWAPTRLAHSARPYHNHHRTRKLPRHPCFYLKPTSVNLSFSC